MYLPAIQQVENILNAIIKQINHHPKTSSQRATPYRPPCRNSYSFYLSADPVITTVSSVSLFTPNPYKTAPFALCRTIGRQQRITTEWSSEPYVLSFTATCRRQSRHCGDHAGRVCPHAEHGPLPSGLLHVRPGVRPDGSPEIAGQCQFGMENPAASNSRPHSPAFR